MLGLSTINNNNGNDNDDVSAFFTSFERCALIDGMSVGTYLSSYVSFF